MSDIHECLAEFEEALNLITEHLEEPLYTVDFVERFCVTENELKVMETNLNDVQLFYTEGILKNMQKIIWNKE